MQLSRFEKIYVRNETIEKKHPLKIGPRLRGLKLHYKCVLHFWLYMPNMYSTLWTSLSFIVHVHCSLVANYYCIFVFCVCLIEWVGFLLLLTLFWLFLFNFISFLQIKINLCCLLLVALVVDTPIYKCFSGIFLSPRYINALVEFGVIIHMRLKQVSAHEQ